ncbi:hypothetical protein [Actinomadura sp. KC216]|uniref:MFS transporter small subunit n=1 Tax=Actinomadura sp. KC216 TaxID=2530370 RepID=UPI00140467C4|nr:hypothetical protein [Actinomadura sp. KC216]
MSATEDRSPDDGRIGSGAADLPRLVISWSIVGIPLIYGVVETIRAILPLFGQ